MPRTHGDAFIPLADIDYAYLEDAPLINPAQLADFAVQDNGNTSQRMGGEGIGLLLELYPRHVRDGSRPIRRSARPQCATI